jgi:P27 family predicted phage terminase small subunit
MLNLYRRLIDQYGRIDEEWLPSLELIAFNYQMIQRCKADMLKNGIEKEDSRGRLARNPSVAVCNQSQNNLFKLLNSFGLNLMSRSKIKQLGGMEEKDGMDELLA